MIFWMKCLAFWRNYDLCFVVKGVTRDFRIISQKKKFRFVTPFKWWWSFILHVVNKFSHMLELQAVYEVEITRILTKIVLEIMLFGRILGIVTWCIVKYLALTLQKLIESLKVISTKNVSTQTNIYLWKGRLL